MSGLKVRVVIEPSGDKKATLKLTYTPAEGDPEESEVVVGKGATESTHEFDLQMNGKLEVEVTKIIELVYDPVQMTVVEKEPPVEPQSAGVSAASAPKSAKEESGASSPAAQEGHSSRSRK